MYQTLIKPLAIDIKKFILDTLFPISCLSCGEEGSLAPHRDEVSGAGFICDECRPMLTKLEHQRCIVCQKPTPFGLTHPKCQTPHGADALISFYDYHDDKMAKIIIHGKYYFLPGVYELLGTMIAKKLAEQYSHLIKPSQQISLRPRGEANLLENDELNSISTSSMTIEPGNSNSTHLRLLPLDEASAAESAPPLNLRGGLGVIYLTPIPLAKSRHRWRGFNQAEILCRTISAQLNLPVADVLLRHKITKTQKDLNKDQRAKNVQDAFALKTKLPSPILGEGSGEGLNVRDGIKGKAFILVDDVTTTGATLQEAAKVLKRNGANQVICLTIARD